MVDQIQGVTGFLFYVLNTFQITNSFLVTLEWYAHNKSTLLAFTQVFSIFTCDLPGSGRLFHPHSKLMLVSPSTFCQGNCIQ